VSIRTLRPSVQPNCCNTCRNAARRACKNGSSATPAKSTPIRRIRSLCCALAASGHAAAALPSSVMNSRRFHLITSAPLVPASSSSTAVMMAAMDYVQPNTISEVVRRASVPRESELRLGGLTIILP
jgi:hypothetical protein